MGRPRLGDNAKTNAVTVKMTAAEVQALDAARGGQTRSAYLRTLFAQGRSAPHPPPGVDPPAPSPTPSGGQASGHLHRRDHVTATRYIKGTRVQTWVCACGQEMQ